MSDLKFTLLPGEHPIVPVMFGEATVAAKVAEEMLKRGVYVVAFSYPVVPMGKARIRTQVSAAHNKEDLKFAAEMFAESRAAS
jgi:glycine C-acetyltransferase